MPRVWPEESLRWFKQSKARREASFQALWAGLPEPSRWAPPDWAPKASAAKVEYARGYERLAKTPVLFALGWDFKGRAADVENGWAAPLDMEAFEWARRQPPKLFAVPASALWRLAGKERWRSFCAQAAGLSEERLRGAILEFAKPLGLGFYDQLAKEWSKAEGYGSLSSQSRVETQNDGGFFAALGVEINPGSLMDQAALGEGAQSVQDRLDRALAHAGERLMEELSGGWALPSAEGEGLCPRQPFPYAWRETSEQLALALGLCQSAWEAGEIERGLGAREPAAARRSRL